MTQEETIARRFHEVYEQLAPLFSYETRKESAVPWADVPERNKLLMVAAVKQLLREGMIKGGVACELC